jgi:hypothetical protein
MIISIAIPLLVYKGKSVPLWVAVLTWLPPVLVFLPPWERWLPGTAIFSGDASPLIRYAPEISFAGLLLGVLSIYLTLRSGRGRQPVVAVPAQDQPEEKHS